MMHEEKTLYDILNNSRGAVGVDIDDVMISIGDTFIEYAGQYFKDRLKRKIDTKEYTWVVLEEMKPMADAGITLEDVSTMLKAMEAEGIIENIMPRPHCIASLKHLSKDKDIYLVTSRGNKYYTDAEGMTNRWLDSIAAYYNFMPEKVIFEHNKDEAAQKYGIGLFFEDNPMVAAKLLDAGIPVILMDKSWNRMHGQDKYLLTEKAYNRKTDVIRHIETYNGKLLFRVPDWSHVLSNLK